METINWTRPPGEPIIWRTINVKEYLHDNTFTEVRLSIQDIPEEKYKDVLDFMCQYFLADEVMNKYLHNLDDKNLENDHRLIWNHYLKQGISIGAFKLNSDGQLGEIVGTMILHVPNDESEKITSEIMMNSKSANSKKIFGFAGQASEKIDICQIYGVNKYMSEFGMSVKPTFRGQKLGVHLLEVWTDVVRKYGLSVASGTFTGEASQIQAERAGFKSIHSVKFSEALDENGQPSFRYIKADSLKLMTKQV